MPPPRKILLPSANKTFVNREKPIAAFEEAAAGITPDASDVLVFYGIGGQGKSSLARELKRKCDMKAGPPYLNLRCAELDLHGRPNSDPEMVMVWLRNAFADAGVAAPCFDLTLGIQWAAQRPEQPLPELRSSWFTRQSDVIGGTAMDLLGIVKDLGGEEIQKIPIFGGLIRKASRWAIRKGYETYLHAAHGPLQELYHIGELKKPYEIAALLPWMLAQDLNNHLRRNADERYVLFIDEYERVFAQGGAAESWSANPFDRNMRSLIAETNGLLAVFFSRERLPWDEDPDWGETLAGRQHLLGGLTVDDAHRYLRAIPVGDDSLREAMIAGARETERADASIYPFMLDLQVEHWRQLIARKLPAGPGHFGVAARDFRGRRREIVERVLRDYDPALQATLRRLACARRFDRRAFDEVVSAFKTGVPGDTFETIAQLSFASTSNDGFVAIHSVMAEAIREMLEPERRAEAVAILFKHYAARAAVASHFDVTDATIAALNEAAHLRREQGIDGYVDWLNTFSEVLDTAARHAVAAEFWREALIAVETTLGPIHPDIGKCLTNLGGIAHAVGDYSASRSYYERALTICETTHGDDHEETASALSDVGAALYALGDYAGAKRLLGRTLVIREKKLAPDDPGIAVSLNNLAETLRELGEDAAAKPLMERSLAIREKVHGPEHPKTATALNNLAFLYENMGDFVSARTIRERSLAIREKILGPDHPVTATSLNNLGNLHISLGEYEKARSLHERSLQIREATIGPDHPDTATSLNNLSYVLSQLGDLDGALRLQERAMNIHKWKFGPEHQKTALSLGTMAHLHQRASRFAEAQSMYEKSLAIIEKTLGPEHVETAKGLYSLADLYEQVGEDGKAMELNRRALTICEKVLGPNHHITARPCARIAKLLQEQGDTAAARPLYERALGATEKAYGIGKPATIKIARNLRKLLLEMGDETTARQLVEKYGADTLQMPAPAKSV